MDLSPLVESLRRDLTASADAAGDDVRRTSERLLFALDPSVRLVLLDALGAAAAEVSAQLDDAAVELRLRGRDPELVVLATDPVGHVGPDAPLPPPTPPTPPTPPGPEAPPEAEAGTARLTLRLPEPLKARAEAVAEREGLSVNAWLVRAVAAAVHQPEGQVPPERRADRRPGRRMTGWAR